LQKIKGRRGRVPNLLPGILFSEVYELVKGNYRNLEGKEERERPRCSKSKLQEGAEDSSAFL